MVATTPQAPAPQLRVFGRTTNAAGQPVQVLPWVPTQADAALVERLRELAAEMYG